MTRHTSVIALAFGVSIALAACQEKKEPSEPALVRSANRDVRSTDQTQLTELRKVTARCHSIDSAKQAGYSTQITPCWAHHSAGAMGYHFGKTNLLDATVALLEPEVIIYEPQAGGHMKMVGMEYIVPLAAWEAAGHDLNNSNDVPQLLGQRFTRHSTLPI